MGLIMDSIADNYAYWLWTPEVAGSKSIEGEFYD